MLIACLLSASVVTNEYEGMWKEATVVPMKAVSRNLPEETAENHNPSRDLRPEAGKPAAFELSGQMATKFEIPIRICRSDISEPSFVNPDGRRHS